MSAITRGLVLTIGAVVVAAIWATSALALSWSSPVRVDDRPPFGQGEPHETSCPTPSLCVAVGGRAILTSTDPAGGPATWTRTGTDFSPEAISCPSETLCVVTTDRGQIASSTNPTGGPSAWNVSAQLTPRGLGGVSCASASLCVALGPGGTGIIQTSTNPTGGASAWTATRLDLPHLQNPGRSVLFRSVSCPSVSFCAIAGSDQAVRRSDVFTSIDPTGGASAWNDRALHHIILIGGISCASRSLCVAAAQPQQFQKYPAPGNLVVSTDPAVPSSTWSVRHPDGSRGMKDVSCPSTKLCTAVDSVGHAITSGHPAGRAQAWQVARIHGLGSNDDLLGVSCPSTSFCVASSLFGRAAVSTHPKGGSAAWKASVIGGWNTLTDVSCASELLCVAVDDAKRVVVSAQPTGGPPAWKGTRLGGLPTSLTGITCPETTLCVGVDGSGDVVTSTDPTGGKSAWRPAHVDAVAHADVSCPSISLCVAVGRGGDLLVSRDPTGGASAWNVRHIDTPDLVGVSCPSVSLCVAVGGDGYIATSRNPAGGTASWSITRVPGIGIGDVSCPSASLCAAIGFAETRQETPYVLTSTRPREQASRWSSYPFFGARTIDCPLTSFCAVADYSTVATTDDPTGGSRTWTTYSPQPFVEMGAVSCPSASLCVAVGMGYEPTKSAMLMVGT